eukprot:GFKZ01003522.1.p1 GENE.GFKZ01003522.1~~GFKZ01003522.1.p1  ORF type:complete len:181 (-),score=12.27 GFKZ01003522.1:11-553(-)
MSLRRNIVEAALATMATEQTTIAYIIRGIRIHPLLTDQITFLITQKHKTVRSPHDQLEIFLSVIGGETARSDTSLPPTQKQLVLWCAFHQRWGMHKTDDKTNDWYAMRRARRQHQKADKDIPTGVCHRGRSLDIRGRGRGRRHRAGQTRKKAYHMTHHSEGEDCDADKLEENRDDENSEA